MPEILTASVPHAEAAAFIRGKPLVSRQVFDGLLPDLQARAFVVTGVEDANVLQAVRDRLADLPQGADWDTVKHDVAAQISPWLGEESAERRAETLLRLHGFQATEAAATAVMQRQTAAFPFWQYVTMGDDRVRDSHAALDGVVLPADSPFWDRQRDWGCRCSKVPLQEDDVRELRAADAKRPPEARRVLDAAERRRLEESNLITRTLPGEGGLPREINTATRGPTRWNDTTLQIGADDLRPRYDAETWANFESWAKGNQLRDGRTVWDWLSTPKPRPALSLSNGPPLTLAASTVENERQALRETRFTGERDLSRGVNETVLLINGKKAVFKPADGERQSPLRRGIKPGTQYRREVAASLVDQELGLGLVPPTTLFTWQGREGSAQLFMEGFKPADAVRNLRGALARLPAAVRHDWQLFDDLIGNLDRHGNNYLVRLAGRSVRLALIDHGLAFSTVAQPRPHPGLLAGQPLNDASRARLERLLGRQAEVRALLSPLLEKKAVDLFFTRARAMLRTGTYGS